MRALEKRPVSMEQVDQAVARVMRELRAMGEKEVESRFIGELVMRELIQLDEVAYVRFASVYRRFSDIQAFHEELEKLSQQT